MRVLRIGDRAITDNDIFVVAEIGNNHNGDPSLASSMIREAARCGCDAVKLQRKHPEILYHRSELDRPYENENSYGRTYGEHKAALELGIDDHKTLKRQAEELGLIYFYTPFDEPAVDEAAQLGLAVLKVASGDLLSRPFLRYIGKTGLPVILSTGGAMLSDIHRALECIGHENVALLHCVASYPTVDKDMNLAAIATLRDEFPDHIIGLSDHNSGIWHAPIAWMLGARLFEKHFTLNRSMRGPDHAFSLEPPGMWRMVEDLRRIPTMLGSGRKVPSESEFDSIRKMGKGICAKVDIRAGDILTPENMCLKSPLGGLPAFMWDDVIGNPALLDIPAGEYIDHCHVAGAHNRFYTHNPLPVPEGVKKAARNISLGVGNISVKGGMK